MTRWLCRLYMQGATPDHLDNHQAIARSIHLGPPKLFGCHSFNCTYSSRAAVLVLISTWTMSLACLVCHSGGSPSQSFRSHSVSSSEGEGHCSAMVSCLTRKVTIATGYGDNTATSKVAPFPAMASGQGMGETPRLLRSRAVTRDLVRDWNFDELLVGS